MADAFLDHPPSSIRKASLTRTIDSYLNYYASGNNHTARAKRLDLSRFIHFLREYRHAATTQKLKVADWDRSSVQAFVEENLRHGEAPATVARRLATLKHMGRTLAEQIAGFTNPAKDVKPPKFPVLKPKALTKGEIRKIRSLAKKRVSTKPSFNRLRNFTILNFLLDTGLRVDEIRLLKLSQIDDKIEWIKNVRTKGRRYRNVYITSEMRDELRRYLEEREKVLKKYYSKLSRSINRNLPLFISTYGAAPGKAESFLMGSKTLWRAVHELSSGTDLHPHLLRHTFASDLLHSSNDIRLVAQALGHSDVRVTMRYTERMDQEVAAALEKSRRKAKH